MEWGQDDSGKFIPLVPLDEHDGLDRTFVDSNGVLRAEHRVVCAYVHGPGLVRVTKLSMPVSAEEVIGSQLPAQPKRRGKRRRAEESSDFGHDIPVNGDIPF